jgi:uncharacterized protein
MELDRFELVLLKRPASSPAISDDEIERLQDLHMGHLVHQTQVGAIRVAGPFDEQPDPTLRGMALYQTGSLEETRSIAAADPAVLAGRLEINVMYFYCPKGLL